MNCNCRLVQPLENGIPCRRKRRIENRKVSTVGRWCSNDIAIVLSTSSESDRRWSVFEELAGCLADRCVRRGSLGVPSNRLLCNDWFERKLQPQLRPIAYAYGLGGFSAIPAPIDFVTAWAVSRSWNLTTTSLTRKHESAVFFHRQRSLPRGRGGRSQYASG